MTSYTLSMRLLSRTTPMASDLQNPNFGPGSDDPAPDREPGRDPSYDTGTTLKTRPKTQKPSMYRVLILNDDYTPMDFVVMVLERIFGKNLAEATDVMLSVHKTGVGLCGIYTYEIAEMKVVQVLTFAREHQHPLQCTMERD